MTMTALSQATRATLATPQAAARLGHTESVANVVADFIRAHSIAQITFMPETADFREGWSVVIGDNRFFGDTVEQAIGKAQL